MVSAESRRSAIEALERLAQLDDADLARALDETRAAEAVAILASPSRSEQRGAAEVLATIALRCDAVRAALERALAAPSQRLRWGAAFTIGRALAEPPPELWPAAREAMALDDGDQRWAAAELACRLARIHAPVRDGIVDALRDPCATLRKMALYCMREIDGRDMRVRARALLSDPDRGTRLAAIAVVARPCDEPDERMAGARALCERLVSDGEAGVRRAAAAGLGKLGERSREVLEALDRAAAAPDASLARAARDAAARLRDAGAAN